ncbi:hypothetical protein BvCmsHHNP023_01128 [Escherichia coli]|nr:FaeA/PapI family transcriptional regulator [Escherichia coli]GCP70766.1 hypothetical protein BvCmsHHNP023_01128 [Escherichia coli]
MKKKQILAFIEVINTPYKTSEVAILFGMSAYQVCHYLLYLNSCA